MPHLQLKPAINFQQPLWWGKACAGCAACPAWNISDPSAERHDGFFPIFAL